MHTDDELWLPAPEPIQLRGYSIKLELLEGDREVGIYRNELREDTSVYFKFHNDGVVGTIRLSEQATLAVFSLIHKLMGETQSTHKIEYMREKA